jgi:hypothetical protein
MPPATTWPAGIGDDCKRKNEARDRYDQNSRVGAWDVLDAKLYGTTRLSSTSTINGSYDHGQQEQETRSENEVRRVTTACREHLSGQPLGGARTLRLRDK